MARASVHGFTVLEVLLATMLLSMLLVVLVGSTRTLSRGWLSVKHNESQMRSIHATYNFLHLALESAQPVFDATTRPPHIQFSGDMHYVDFISVSPTHFDIPGLYRMRIDLRGEDLVVSYQLARDGGPTTSAITHRILADVNSVEFKYFGQQNQQSSRTWHAAWQSPLTLPEAVRISLSRDNVAFSWTIPIRAQGADLTPQ